jgi:hypothetical protein
VFQDAGASFSFDVFPSTQALRLRIWDTSGVGKNKCGESYLHFDDMSLQGGPGCTVTPDEARGAAGCGVICAQPRILP